MKHIRTSDILAGGLLINAIIFLYLTFTSLQLNLFFKILGIIGSLSIILAEGIYLFQFWRRK